jgi:hypothetical protein
MRILVKIGWLLLISMASALIVGGLMLRSQMGRSNSFDFHRRIVNDAISARKVVDLEINSYTILSVTDSTIFLDNRTAPRLVVKYNLLAGDTQHVIVKVRDMEDIPFRTPSLAVAGGYLFLADPSVPIVMRGEIGQFRINDALIPPTFSDFLPISGKSVVLKTYDRESESDVLGLLRDDGQYRSAPAILEKQIDGIFCVDGVMLKNDQMDMVVYIYFYRNQFICLDLNLNLLSRVNTVDPINEARIEVGGWKEDTKSVTALSGPPLRVNYKASTSGHYLYNISSIRSDSEELKAFDSSYVVDVYDLTKTSYVYSFYIVPPIEKKTIRTFDFAVYGNYLVGIFDFKLIIYTLVHRPE